MACEQHKYELFKTMDSEQLKDVLRAELSKDDTNIELIKAVNAVLSRRCENTEACNIDDAWEDFKENHANNEPIYEVKFTKARGKEANRRSLRAISRGALAAAVITVLLLFSMFTAYAEEYDVWNAVAAWTKDTFSFVNSGTSVTETRAGNREVPEQLTELQTAMDEYGLTGSFLPAYLPEGYEVQEVTIDYLETFDIFHCLLSKNDRFIIMQYQVYRANQSPIEYQKDDVEPEVYETGGIEHYIVTNYDLYYAAWKVENIECSIYGLDSKEEIIKIIDSIYER